jgi:hypothetical protein
VVVGRANSVLQNELKRLVGRFAHLAHALVTRLRYGVSFALIKTI